MLSKIETRGLEISPAFDSAIAKTVTKIIIGIILPSAKALKGFLGITSRKICVIFSL